MSIAEAEGTTMRRMVICGFAAFLFTSSLPAGELVRLNLKDGASVAGEVVAESDGEIELFDLSTGKTRPLMQTDIAQRRSLNTDRSRIEAFGLAVYLAWKIKDAVQPSFGGKIAQVDEREVTVAIRSGKAPAVGEVLIVERESGEVKDPDTGEILGVRRAKIGLVAVTQREDRFIIAGVQDSSQELRVGDTVSWNADVRKIAVLPLVDSNQQGQYAGFAEELTTGLTKNGTRVVERSLLNRVLDELALQHTDDFDAAAVQEIGKQVGAYALLIGSVVEKERYPEAHLRLVRVETGEVLFACAHRLTRATSELPDKEQPPHSGAKDVLRAHIENTSWRFNKGESILTYHPEGVVTCNHWDAPGKWFLESANSICQEDERGRVSRCRITFSADFRTATVKQLDTGKTYVLDRVE